MEERVKNMSRAEQADALKSIAHNLIHMNELPQERVAWAVRLVDVTNPHEFEWAEEYIRFWADFLLLLSNEVREAGQGALQKNLALHHDGISEKGSQDTGGR